MKAKFEKLLKEKGLTLDNLSAPQKANANSYYTAVSQLEEAAKEADYDPNNENVKEVEAALTEIDNTICKYISNYEVYQERGRKMQEARVAKKQSGGTVAPIVEEQQQAETVEQQEAAPIVVEEQQAAAPVVEEKKGWGVGAVVGTVLGVVTFALLGVQISKGNIPFKRR